MWFMYLANVLPSLAAVFMCLGFMVGGAGFILCVAWVWSYSVEEHSYELPTCFKWITLVALVFAFLGTITPSEQTFYLMAGAKGAEVVVESETGQEILSDIQEVIQYQLGTLKEPLTNE
jgi:hypothetical protein